MTNRSIFILLGLQLLLTGCRTYGDYGEQDKTVVQVERINEQFLRALGRAENELSVVEAAAQRNVRLIPLAEEYADVVAEHARLAELHELELAALLGRLHGYRATSRLFGAIVTDQHAISNRYAEVSRRIGEVSGLSWSPTRGPDTYQHVPPHFLRIQYAAEAVEADEAITSIR